MSRAGTPPEQGGSVGPALAVVLATVSFVALVVFGWGMLSLLLSEDVIPAKGLGPVPGVISLVTGAVVFGLSLALVARAQHPSFWNSAWITAAVLLAVVLAAFLAAAGGADLGVAAGVAARFAVTWVGAVVAAAAFVCAWGGIALVRTRAGRPRWPWERDDV